MMSHDELKNLVFEYKSTRPANNNGPLSSGATPIYYTIEGTTVIVYTPAAWMDANRDCASMFFQTFGGHVEQIDFGTRFNTSNVTDMSYMFSNCQNLGSLNLSNLNLQSVTTMNV